MFEFEVECNGGSDGIVVEAAEGILEDKDTSLGSALLGDGLGYPCTGYVVVAAVHVELFSAEWYVFECVLECAFAVVAVVEEEED